MFIMKIARKGKSHTFFFLQFDCGHQGFDIDRMIVYDGKCRLSYALWHGKSTLIAEV